MGPPHKVNGNIEDPTRTIGMDKKKAFLKKYKLETEDGITMKKNDSREDNTWSLSNHCLGTESRTSNMAMDATSISGRWGASENTLQDATTELATTYMHHLALHSPIKQDPSEPQLYSPVPHYIKQEQFHDSVRHSHRYAMPSSFHNNDCNNDYNCSFNNIPLDSLNLSGDSNYYSPVQNSDQDRTCDLSDYTNSEINQLYPNYDYYQHDRLQKSDIEDYNLSLAEKYDGQRNDFNGKTESYEYLDCDAYSSYDEEQPLDLTMRKNCSLSANSHLEEEEEILGKQSFEAGSPYYPEEEADDEVKKLLQKIKTGTRSRVRSPKSWEFLLRMLLDEQFNPRYIRWEDQCSGTFRLVRKDDIAKIWGTRSEKHKDGGLTYDNFARNLRYHYKTKMLLPVSEKHLVYKFGDEIMVQLRKNGTYPFPT